MDINLGNIMARIKMLRRNEMEYSDENLEQLCTKLKNKTISDSEVATVLDAARILPDANRRIKQLKAQLPPELQHSIILLKGCERGHTWLTASNWVESGECPWCKMKELESRNTSTNHGYLDLQYQLDSAVAENEKLEKRIDAFIKIGRKPLEECYKTQNILRDRLDRISARLMQVPNIDWKNGDGVDDIAIKHMDFQDRMIRELSEMTASLRKTIQIERRDHDYTVRHFQYLLRRADLIQLRTLEEPCLPHSRICNADKDALSRVASYMESQRSISSPYFGWTEDVAVLRRLFRGD